MPVVGLARAPARGDERDRHVELVNFLVPGLGEMLDAHIALVEARDDRIDDQGPGDPLAVFPNEFVEHDRGIVVADEIGLFDAEMVEEPG